MVYKCKFINCYEMKDSLDFTPHKHFLDVDSMTFPVLTLDYEYEDYVKLGRAEKIQLLDE